MWRAVKLPDIHHVALVLKHRRFVVVHVEVVGCGEDGHDGGEARGFGFAVHSVAGDDISTAAIGKGK